jgi:plasmid stabilization system protein ParE
MEADIQNLSGFPYIGKEDDATKVRRIVKNPYVIYYTVNDEAQTVEVVHIRHSARKPQK